MHITRANLSAFLNTWGQQMLDILFPLQCIGCGKKKSWICDLCLHHIPLRLEQHCPACLRHTTPFGQVCFACQDSAKPALDGLFIASYYRDTLLPRAIHTYKYRFIKDLSIPLGSLLLHALSKTDLPLPDTLIPVPLHSRRLRFRGFNQAELLARILSSQLTPGLEIPLLTDTLLRIRSTKPQMKTESREERLTNLKNAFRVATGKRAPLEGKSLWLIDDVATTGTTLEECALVLKQAGAKSVFGIVLAR